MIHLLKVKTSFRFLYLLIFLFLPGALLSQMQTKEKSVLVMLDISKSIISDKSIKNSDIANWSAILEKVIYENPGDAGITDAALLSFPIVNANTKISLYTIGNKVTPIVTAAQQDSRTEITRYFPKSKSDFTDGTTDIDAAEYEYWQNVEKSAGEVYWILFSDEEQSLTPQKFSSEILRYRTNYHNQVLYLNKLHQYVGKDGNQHSIKISVSKIKSDPGKWLTFTKGVMPDSITLKKDSISGRYGILNDESLQITCIDKISVDDIKNLEIWVKIFDKDKNYLSEFKLTPKTLPFKFTYIDTSLFRQPIILAGHNKVHFYLTTRYRYDNRIINQDITERGEFINVGITHGDTPPPPPPRKPWWILIILFIVVGGVIAYLLSGKKGVIYTIKQVDGGTSNSKEFKLKNNDQIFLGRVESAKVNSYVYDVDAPNYRLVFISRGVFTLYEKDQKRDVKAGTEFEVFTTAGNPIKLNIIEGKLQASSGSKTKIHNPHKNK